MGFHTFDADRADNLEDESRFRYVSVDELLALFDPGPESTVADLGSGTGFYTDEIAPYADTVYAVDVQEAMHDHYREKGLPENVDPVTAEVGSLPFPDDHLDGAVSTMTYHEFATEPALAELRRVLAPGARLGVADWTAAGLGERGPPVGERFAAEEARAALDAAGFVVERAEDRRETFVCTAIA
ncbi:methyltransferase domain-containing protein [Halapricum sp. CBA1109]|uniref:class I SAM-dependent methyltransferase n=1 Tax=Halapricum sp. CBA1109 TaxID=2668068 RepID=UPI0012FB4B02|nr:class I SAM-dependent methyltransferase [Halapricum sp. CBA1109]MUV89964.1 methyltransferase domain-containing protein [Halapricum sp. CBA1109]